MRVQKFQTLSYLSGYEARPHPKTLSICFFVKGSSDKFEKLCEESESRQEYCTTAYLYNITQGRKRTKWTKTSPIRKSLKMFLFSERLVGGNPQKRSIFSRLLHKAWSQVLPSWKPCFPSYIVVFDSKMILEFLGNLLN